MANIMINEACNQHCSYCFASEFVNVNNKNITPENFKKAVSFILSEIDSKRKGRIGIIGGEPLLHPNFDEFIHYLTQNEDVEKITVYTNGVLVKDHLTTFLDDKVGALININSIKDVGESNFRKTEEAIDLLINHYNKRDKITIGLNIYDNIDYSFFINLAEKYRQTRVRLSIVVPSYGQESRGLPHFLSLKSTVLKIAKSLLLRDIRFRFDCNLPVKCIWTEEELENMSLMGLSSQTRDLISLVHAPCAPVIDILQDLNAIRCFGLSKVSKVSINNFNSIKELRDYYIENYDIPFLNKTIDSKCNECALHLKQCYGGCLANRVDVIAD